MFNKKICAVCLSTDQPMLAIAAWRDGELFIAETEKLPVRRHSLEEELIPKIIGMEQKEFEVLVDESGDFITSRAGQRVRLSDTGASGKPILVESLDTFRELERQKAIFFPDNAAGRYRLPDTILDMERDGKGNTVYRIDWAQLKSEHVLSMLCSYATVFHNVTSTAYLNAMLGESRKLAQPSDPLDPLKAIVRATEHRSWLNGPSSPLTGKGNYL